MIFIEKTCRGIFSAQTLALDPLLRDAAIPSGGCSYHIDLQLYRV